MRRLAFAAACFFLIASSAVGFGTVGAAPVARPGAASAAAPSPAIEWREWSREAFDEAKAKKKLVLLNITAEWCHWCRVMAEDSYTDSAVVAEVRANYIPIRVGYDLRPDIGDRYLTNGWPTTGVLSTNGHLLLAKTYLPPRDLQRFLTEAVHFYRVNRQQVDRRIAEAERAVERTWQPDSLLPPTLSEEEYIERNIEALRDTEDKVHGGFGDAPKTAHWDAISFLLRAADAKRDDGLRALAVRATAAALALQDSVDGGFFRFALESDWSKMRYERLLDEQAKALSILTRVYRATGEERFKVAADRVASFVDRTLSISPWGAITETRGLVDWYIAAMPDVRNRDGSWLDGDVYFRLSRDARARVGRLIVPRTLNTDASARMASSFLAYERLQKSARSRLSTRFFGPVRQDVGALVNRNGVGLDHDRSEGRRNARSFLADQVATGNALLDAYGASRNRAYLTGADSIAAWLRAWLEDPDGGGFRYAPRDTTSIGRLRAGDKPETANVEAGQFFLRRYWLNGRDEDRGVAERTARFLQSGDKIVLDPARAELVLRLRSEPVRLLVVDKAASGPGTTRKPVGGVTPASTQADALWGAACGAPVPEVVVRYQELRPGESAPNAWPDGPPPNAQAPAIYRWTSTGWRGPVTDPKRLSEILDPVPAARP